MPTQGRAGRRAARAISISDTKPIGKRRAFDFAIIFHAACRHPEQVRHLGGTTIYAGRFPLLSRHLEVDMIKRKHAISMARARHLLPDTPVA